MGAFGTISSFASRRRGRSCVRLAGIAFCKADEPTFWPRSDYGRFFGGSLTSTHVRTCSRTTRATALRMGGFEAARWREKFRLRHSETCGRGRVRDFHGAHLFFAGARRSLFFVGFALPLENREENEAFLAFVRWALPRMLAKHLFLRFIAFSRSSSSLSFFVFFTSFISTSLPLLR